ncbi:ribonuclease s-2 [Nicotiana attenuata]|uniref:Ribonuclease s-2 n=1 Tax=Nicotiana attenuata TaxID=49451 RepID=A0A314L2T7_NICAT|nr:ribonuclease s-2 [Nicotiana attenuata]
MFKSQLISALFILLFTLSHVYGNFDYLQLVLTWPPSFCFRPKNICKRTSNNFTIHGLWPENKHFRLEFCTGKTYKRYDEKDRMVNDLDKDHHWIQLKFDENHAKEKQPSGTMNTQGTEHTFNETRDAIKKVTNQVDPDLKCVEHIKGTPELKEIGICFTPNADSFYPCRHSKTCDETGSTKILFR